MFNTRQVERLQKQVDQLQKELLKTKQDLVDYMTTTTNSINAITTILKRMVT